MVGYHLMFNLCTPEIYPLVIRVPWQRSVWATTDTKKLRKSQGNRWPAGPKDRFPRQRLPSLRTQVERRIRRTRAMANAMSTPTHYDCATKSIRPSLHVYLCCCTSARSFAISLRWIILAKNEIQSEWMPNGDCKKKFAKTWTFQMINERNTVNNLESRSS